MPKVRKAAAGVVAHNAFKGNTPDKSYEILNDVYGGFPVDDFSMQVALVNFFTLTRYGERIDVNLSNLRAVTEATSYLSTLSDESFAEEMLRSCVSSIPYKYLGLSNLVSVIPYMYIEMYACNHFQVNMVRLLLKKYPMFKRVLEAYLSSETDNSLFLMAFQLTTNKKGKFLHTELVDKILEI